VGVWEITNGASLGMKGLYEIERHRTQYPCLAVPAGARVAVLDSYKRLVDGVEEKDATHYAFIAGGSQGLFIYKVENNGAIDLVGRIPLTDCFQVAVDKERRLAYAADGANGIAVVDISNPVQPDHICSILNENSDTQDDRILARIQVNDLGSETTLIVDSDTGLLYTGQYSVDPSKSGLAVAGARIPRMEFLLEDTANPGTYKVAKSYLSAFDEDQPKLALWINGGAGTVIGDNTLKLFDRKGFGEEAAKNSQGTPVPTTVERTGVVLARKSQKKTDKDYNLYIQQDKTTLMMNYDPAKENPMVTKQGGTLQATITATGWWNKNKPGYYLTFSKPVSRPWVEWKSDELVDPESTETLPIPEGYEGPKYLALNQPRSVSFLFNDETQKIYPANVTFRLSQSGPVEISPNMVSVTKYGQKVKFQINGKTAADTPSPVNLYIEVADPAQPSAKKSLFSISMNVFEAGLAVDYNRDGEIEFDDPFTQAGNDHVPGDKPFEFWLNDDYDYQKEVDTGYTGEEKFYQDDRENNLVPYGSDMMDMKDYRYDKIQVERDLEDFNRFAIKKINDAFPESSNFEYVLSLRSSESPMIKVYRAKLAKDDYLTDFNRAQEQINSKLVGTVITAKNKEQSRTIKSELLQSAAGEYEEGSGAVPFLFEGAYAGSGKLWCELYKEGVAVGRYKVPISLKPITAFYEEYTVGDNQLLDPSMNATELHPLPAPQADDDKNYILYVHGWNWDTWQKQRYAETTFKRLYWLGYKGRFGSFRWPDYYSADDSLVQKAWTVTMFDSSERHALWASFGLKNVLAKLKGQGYNVHLYGHSQGTMVISETLRNIALDTSLTKPYVESMTFSQSAVSARAYQSDYDAYAGWGSLWFNVWKYGALWAIATTWANLTIYPIPDTWPDLQGHYPYYLEMDRYPKVYAPYFEPVKMAVKTGKMFNFYNPVDFPTGEYTPGENFSGSWLIDQLIKPWRGLKMNFGVSSLDDSEKLLFTRNDTRKDFYCMPVLYIPPVPPQCTPGVEMYDFKNSETRFFLMAFGGASYSKSLGGHDANVLLGAESGFSGNEINLQTVYDYNNYVMWHGAQFRGSQALPGIGNYWSLFLDNIGIPHR
jgi:hypothetical protein